MFEHLLTFTECILVGLLPLLLEAVFIYFQIDFHTLNIFSTNICVKFSSICFWHSFASQKFLIRSVIFKNSTSILKESKRFPVDTGGGPHTPGFSDTCSGSLMALHHGRWVTVMLRQQSNETKKNMVQHCNDFGSIFAENGTVPMNTCLSDCTIINSNLYICAKAEPDNCSNVIKVICGESSNS